MGAIDGNIVGSVTGLELIWIVIKYSPTCIRRLFLPNHSTDGSSSSCFDTVYHELYFWHTWHRRRKEKSELS